MIWFCEAKTFRRKIVTKPSKAWIFSMAENNDTLKSSTMKVFGSVRQTVLDRCSWYSPFLSIDFFATGKILKHSTEGLLHETFQHYETTNFSPKVLTSPLHTLIYTFSISEINERLKGSPTAFFGTVGQNFFEGTLDTSPHLLSINFSATRKILRHSTEGFLYKMLLYCETKSFRRKIVT